MNLFHGTNHNFSEIDFSKSGSVTNDMSVTGGLGFWATPSADYAADYARNAAHNGGEAIILTVEAEVEEMIWGTHFTCEDIEEFVDEFGIEEARRILEEDEGRDGIIVETFRGREYCFFTADYVRIA